MTRFMKGALLVGASIVSLGIAGAQAQEIKVWTLTFANESANTAWKSIIADFEAANPGVKITVENRATDEHKSALRVAANSDQAPDIFFSWGGLGLGGEFVKSGLALDMTKYYQQYKWNDEFIPASLSFSTQYPGGTFGVPYTFHGEALYYSKPLFAKAGITELPKTWQELDAAAEKLKAAGVPAYAFGGTVNWHVMRMMDAVLEAVCGIDKHDALMSMQVNWTQEPCATDSFKEFHNLTSNYFLKPFMGIDQLQAFNLFIAGRAAMMLEGDWMVSQLKAAGVNMDDYGVFQIPTGTGRLYGFAEYNYISTKSANPDIAAKFLDYLESTEVQQKYLGEFGATSVNKNITYTNPDAITQEWLDIFNTSKGMYVNGDQAFPLTETTEYWRIINEVASDNLDPAEAAGQLQSFIDTHPGS